MKVIEELVTYLSRRGLLSAAQVAELARAGYIAAYGAPRRTRWEDGEWHTLAEEELPDPYEDPDDQPEPAPEESDAVAEAHALAIERARLGGRGAERPRT